MRALTEAEARVVGALLADTALNERERLHQLGLPRSTYHAVRRRAYSEGWLLDRYVPDPVALGWPAASILLVRPFAEQRSRWAEEVSAEAGAVLLWEGVQFSLAFLFHRSAADGQSARRRLTDPRWVSASIALDPSPTPAGVPVYFDFEGLWRSLTQTPGAWAYPRGLPQGVAERPEDGSIRSPRSRWAARELLRRPFSQTGGGRPAHLVGPFGVPSAQRRLIEQGVIAHRVLVDPARLPAYQSRRPSEVVLLTGELREDRSVGSLFQELTRTCRVFPFLVGVSGSRVLLGALGQTGGRSLEAAVGAPPRPPVLATLEGKLEGIELFREEAEHLTLRLDHRFDRLAPGDHD